MLFFFFNHTSTTEIYTLSLHDALPICVGWDSLPKNSAATCWPSSSRDWLKARDRKSTRLNSSHVAISYAVFCLKKKKGAHCSTSAQVRNALELCIKNGTSNQKADERIV